MSWQEGITSDWHFAAQLIYTAVGIAFPYVGLAVGFVDIIWGNDIFNDGFKK